MKTINLILTINAIVIFSSISSVAQFNDISLNNTYMGATYYGGSDYDYGKSIATDSDNNFYVVGQTSSTDFPVYNQGGGSYFQGNLADGNGDIYIIKFNSDGVREWATYYGGNSTDYVNSIAIDENDNILLTGITYSTDFPVFDPGSGAYFQGPSNYGDVFIIKFNSNGERLWATCYGGHDGMGFQEGHSITSDLNNNIIVTGGTQTTNFPVFDAGGASYYQNTLGGSGDAFILKFNADGVRQWATYYGSTDFEYGHSITTDSEGNILITGFTLSYDFPLHDPGSGAFFQGTQSGNGDAFILKFTQDGVRQWSTYYGGSEDDRGFGITASENNSILLTGKTLSPDLPVFNSGTGAYFEDSFTGVVDAFILKFTTTGIREWATYYGACNGLSITTDGNNNILLTGISNLGFSVFDPGGGAYFQEQFGDGDAFILEFNSNGVRKWATCYGGFDGDGGHSITTDGNNNILVAGHTGSSDFPVFNPIIGSYFQGSNAGWTDSFILCFDSTGVISGPVGIHDLATSQDRHALYQNSPNPCRNFTEIKYFLSESGVVQIDLYDMLGRKIKTLVNQFRDKGTHLLELNVNDIETGIYFYDLKIDYNLIQTKRMEIIR